MLCIPEWYTSGIKPLSADYQLLSQQQLLVNMLLWLQDLVNTKMELAQCSEREVVGRRELYKAKETNMKLASKMTRLEVQMYKK
jgi:hypothetical protein